jgi:hypothetical protein
MTSRVKEATTTAESSAPPARADPIRRRGRRSLTVQTKLLVNAPGDEYEREADRLADRIWRQSDSIRPPIGIAPKRPTSRAEDDARRRLAPAAESAVEAVAGGQPLPASVARTFESRFGYDFGNVRVHTDAIAARAAQAARARAFTRGSDIVFGAGAFAPETPDGGALLAHELVHVVQQGWAAPSHGGDPVAVRGMTTPVLQRANPADPRLPRDQPEAIAFATAAKAQIDAANARLARAVDPRSRNVPALIAQRGMTIAALTPRDDSVVAAPEINFFAGQVDYSDSIQLPARATHHVNAARNAVRIRARDHANVDNLLPGAEIEARVVQAVSEVASTAAVRSGAPNRFDLYVAQFDALWHVPPFSAQPTTFAPGSTSKGPRTVRSRAIFDRIYADDPALKAAYDANTAGIRERIDVYTAPAGLNPLNSPRLQTLRAAFFPVPRPVPTPAYPAFRASVQAASAALDQADRDAVDNSNEWQLLINEHVTSEARRAEIRTIIRTPPAPPPVVAPAAPAPVPAGPAGGGVTPQMFVDAVRLVGPASPVLATGRREPVELTPRSVHANPAVPIDTRVTVTPAARVDGRNVSPDSRWPNAAATGVPFEPDVINTGTVVMTAHLDLVNGPGGLAPAAPTPDLPITVQDDRQANFVATWFGAVNFNSGAGQEWFAAGKTVAYRGGTQNFGVGAFLPAAGTPNTNPGLTLFVRARIKRGPVVIAAPGSLEPYPPDARGITPIRINIPSPGVAVADPLDFEIELIAADRTTILDTKVIAIAVDPEATYTKAQAIATATADDTHLHDTSPAGLLGKMVAAGGVPANVAAAVKPLPPASPPPGPLLTLRPLTVRHDSSGYVSAVSGGPDPSKVGYFVGTSYNLAAPDAAHSFAGVAGAAAFFIPSGFGPRFVVANRTTDVAAGSQRTDDELITLITHEAVHAVDVVSAAGTSLARYKKEFRAYWVDGRFGPPNVAVCPVAPGGCKDARTDLSMPPPGPKSPRARAIFEIVYGSTTYPFVKPAYDNNTGGFRTAVDAYVIPDGINLIVSVRLEALRQIIQPGITTANLAAQRARVRAFMGVGAPPAVGALNQPEKDEIARSRAWRDLIDSRVTGAANRALIKSDLGIPT